MFKQIDTFKKSSGGRWPTAMQFPRAVALDIKVMIIVEKWVGLEPGPQPIYMLLP